MFAGPTRGTGRKRARRGAGREGGAAAPQPRGLELLLDGLATYFRDGYAAAVPILRRSQRAFGAGDARERATALEVAGGHLVRPPLG